MIDTCATCTLRPVTLSRCVFAPLWALRETIQFENLKV